MHKSFLNFSSHIKGITNESKIITPPVTYNKRTNLVKQMRPDLTVDKVSHTIHAVTLVNFK